MDRCFVPECKRKVKFNLVLEPLGIVRYSCKKHLSEGAVALLNMFFEPRFFEPRQFVVVSRYLSKNS